jgi:hypothetical protein
LQNLHQLFDWQYIGQLYVGDFAKFVAFSEYMNFTVKSGRNLPARWWTHNVAKTFSMRYFKSFFYFNSNKNDINPFHDRERIYGIFYCMYHEIKQEDSKRWDSELAVKNLKPQMLPSKLRCQHECTGRFDKIYYNKKFILIYIHRI